MSDHMTDTIGLFVEDDTFRGALDAAHDRDQWGMTAAIRINRDGVAELVPLADVGLADLADVTLVQSTHTRSIAGWLLILQRNEQMLFSLDRHAARLARAAIDRAAAR